MATVCIFFIGSGHGSDEDMNVLVKLNKHCQLGPLGVEGNHMAGKISRLAKRATAGTYENIMGGGWQWINEGQDAFGSGLNQQAEANVNRISKIMKNASRGQFVDKVVLVGHSRGAVCAMMVANKLHSKYGSSSPNCHLFLYDPVKRSAVGMQNTIIKENVKSLRVLVAEDNADGSAAGRDMFTPTLPRNGGGSDPNYIRVPGTHGTMTQVNGEPIGSLGFLLALEWLKKTTIAVPMKGTDTRPQTFCDVYSKIVASNPIAFGANGVRMRKITDMGKVKTGNAVATKHVPVGGGIVTREYTELGWQGNETKSYTRSEYLHSMNITNKWQGNGFFVNQDHRARFAEAYPMCSRFVQQQSAQGPAAEIPRSAYSELNGMPATMLQQFRHAFLS